MRRVVLVAAVFAAASAANLREPAAKAIKKAAVGRPAPASAVLGRLPHPAAQGQDVPPAWKSLPAKVHSIEDACRMNDMEPTKRQCQRSSCFQVMLKANKRYCCCASMVGGWVFDAMTNCTTDMQCPQAMPSHLVRPVPSLREQLSYNTKLSICAEHCVDACATQGHQWTQQQHEAAANASADTPHDALVTSLVELSTAHMVAALAKDRCEDRCIESCLQTAHPSITVGAFLEMHEHARRTAHAEAPGLAHDIAAVRAKLREIHNSRTHKAADAATDSAAKDESAGSLTDPATGDSLVAPSYSNAPRFSSAKAGAQTEAATQTAAQAATTAGAAAAAKSASAQGAGAGAGAGAGSGAKWWTNPPPWWLPPPPEWGAPPPNVYSAFYSPYNAQQATPQMALPQGGYPAAQASPLPH